MSVFRNFPASDDKVLPYPFEALPTNKLIREKNRLGRKSPLVTMMVLTTFVLYFIFRSSTSLVSLSYSIGKWETFPAMRISLPSVFPGTYTKNKVNSTLGFEKILVLNLPSRSNKKDEMTMMASMSNINLTFIDAKHYSQLDPAGLPWHRKFEMPGILGVFRAHADAWQKILQENWSSALILEDDTDWDVNLRYAMQQLHQPLAALINSYDPIKKYRASTEHDPWLSSEWDVLNLGLCLESTFKAEDRQPELVDNENPPHVLYEDNTMPDQEDSGDNLVKYYERYNYTYPKKSDNPSAPRQRLVSLSHWPICMNAYAVSKRGALRMLFHTTRGLNNPVDLMMADLCADDKIRSYEVIPPIMGQWKIEGGGVLNSDNERSKASSAFEHDNGRPTDPSKGHAWFIRNSFRKAMPEIIANM
jgi:GR25 family glycosyltransferase involved in LPS biosynthesis